MFQAQGIEKHYGARTVLDGITCTLGAGERVGLVGRNGCGKSTLLRILAGMDRPDRGGVSAVRHGLSVGYQPQAPDFPTGRSVFEAVYRGLPPCVPEWEARRALVGLGFSLADTGRPAVTLSGGEKTRLMLARLLLGGHDLLLLDEPTSHLDIPMIEWLESYLRSYRGTYLVASHDRRFLDNCVERIVELDSGRLREYHGGYADYAEARQRAVESQREDYTLQQRQIRALQEFAGRQMAWSQRTQSGPKRGRDQRGRISEKMAKRAHAAERRVEQIERVEKLRDEHHVSARFQPDRRSGQCVFELRGVARRFGDRTLFEDLDLTIARSDRVGIVGPNGAGKTTLLRLLLGLDDPTAGTARIGPGVAPFYLAQEHEELDPALTVIETVEQTGRLSHTDARTLLACFLFRDTEVFKRVGDLSSGERARLAVAASVVSGGNVLVLDEPTNHLDIDTRERLERALEGYDGTLLVVSHDRYLLERLTNRTLGIGDGRVIER